METAPFSSSTLRAESIFVTVELCVKHGYSSERPNPSLIFLKQDCYRWTAWRCQPRTTEGLTRKSRAETYWIPNSFSNASNHSKFSIAATANVQVNYEQQIFDKEKSSDFGWQASILAKVILIILPITKITRLESCCPTAPNAL
ncbi:uncharacterized protein LJ206_011196 isoform 1-T1 [Theristicus caerulescens]